MTKYDNFHDLVLNHKEERRHEEMKHRKRDEKLHDDGKKVKKKHNVEKQSEQDNNWKQRNELRRVKNKNAFRIKQQAESQTLDISSTVFLESRCSLQHEAFHYDPQKYYSNYPSLVMGKMNEICNFCAVKKFDKETPSVCC